MDVAAIFRAILTPEQQERAPEQFARLKVGDRLTGRVLKMEADGRLLIDLGRFKALADTNLPVQVGQRLTLQVTQMGNPIQLRLESEAQPAGQQLLQPRMALATLLPAADQQRVINTIDRLLNLPTGPQVPPAGGEIGGRPTAGAQPAAASSLEMPAQLDTSLPVKGALTEPVRQALAQLKALFDPMPLEASAAQRTQWVQSTVEDHGILFELKLASAIEQAAKGTGSVRPPADTPVPAGPPATEAFQAAKPPPTAKMDFGSPPLAASVSDSVPTPDGEATVALDVGMALGTKIQSGRHANAEAIPDKSATAHPTPDPQTVEQAQRIIARDLKPHLMILEDFLAGVETQDAAPLEAHAKDVAFLRQAVNQLSAHLDQQLDQAVRRAGEPDLYQVFTHLLPIKDQQPPVQLKVYYPKRGRAAEADPQHRVSLLLMLDRLGPVRADLAMVERSLRIGFYVRDAGVQQVFEKNGQAIADALAGQFDQVQISTQVSKEKIAQFEGEDLMGPPVGRIDVQA